MLVSHQIDSCQTSERLWWVVTTRRQAGSPIPSMCARECGRADLCLLVLACLLLKVCSACELWRDVTAWTGMDRSSGSVPTVYPQGKKKLWLNCEPGLLAGSLAGWPWRPARHLASHASSCADCRPARATLASWHGGTARRNRSIE